MRLLRNFEKSHLSPDKLKLAAKRKGVSNRLKSIGYVFLIILFFCLVGTQSRAAAIKVAPSEIKVETKSGVSVKKELLVENPSPNVALYQVYVDDFSDWIKIKPESFTLESGESKKVILEIKNKEGGAFSTFLSIVAKPLSQRKFKANSGVKIPLEVKISEEKSKSLAAIIGALKGRNLIYLLSMILFLTLIGIFLAKKRRAKKIDYDEN